MKLEVYIRNQSKRKGNLNFFSIQISLLNKRNLDRLAFFSIYFLHLRQLLFQMKKRVVPQTAKLNNILDNFTSYMYHV